MSRAKTVEGEREILVLISQALNRHHVCTLYRKEFRRSESCATEMAGIAI